MRHSAQSTRIGIAVSFATCLILSSCRGPAGSVAIVDPVIAYLSPGSVRSFSSVAGKPTILPETGTQAALYAALDAATPLTVFLTPLLGNEIPAILSRNDSTRVAYLGTAAPQPDPRLYAAIFSPIDAAEAGGRLAAEEASRLRGEPPARVAAVFSGANDIEARADAFVAAFVSAGGTGEPVIEFSASGFSQAVADKLKSMDIRVAYVSSSPRDSESWTVEAFDPYAFVAAEYAMPIDRSGSSANAFIVWDIEKTLSLLGANLSKDRFGSFPGAWKTVRNGQTGGNLP